VERVFVGITGASGHAYALHLVRCLAEAGLGVDVAVTDAGAKVLRHETGLAWAEGSPEIGADVAHHLEGIAPGLSANLRAFGRDAIESPPSSGTAKTRAVILCPCSMGTLARVAAGFSSNLVERAADVALKEGRRLVIVPRETPFSALHLENMLRLAKLGATIVPAAPGFYHRPQSIDDLVTHLVGKILDQIGVDHPSAVRWKGTGSDPAGGEPPVEEGTEPRTGPHVAPPPRPARTGGA